MKREQTDQTQVNFAELTNYEQAIYNDVYLNIPIRMIAKSRGYIGDAGRQKFQREYEHIINAAHLQHMRDLFGAQWELAVADKNPTMLIFLGKQAGQSDLVMKPMGEEASDVVQDPTIVNIIYPKKPGSDE